MDPDVISRLIIDYERNPNQYTDEQAEAIALLARQLSMPFDRESQPIKKFLYGAGEMATFGMLPDSWEPHSRGQDVYGETAIDAIASGAGSLFGLVGGGVGAYRGARGLFRKGAESGAAQRVRERVATSDPLRSVRDRINRRIDPYFDIGRVGYY